MDRKLQILVRAAFIVTDAIAIAVSFYWIRDALPTPLLIAATIVFCFVFLAVFGAYRFTSRRSVGLQVVGLVLCILGGVLVAWHMSSRPNLGVSDLALFILSSVLLMLVLRNALYRWEHYLYRRQEGMIRVLVIGMSRASATLVERMLASADTARFEFVGYLHDRLESSSSLAHLGKVAGVESVIQERCVDVVLHAGLPEQMVTVSSICQRHHLDYVVLPSMLGAFGQRLSVEYLGGFPVLRVRESGLFGWGYVFKRVFDVCLALFLIMCLSPIWVLTIIALVIERRGIHIFAPEQRVDGRTGNTFSMLRFVTLRPGEGEEPLTQEEVELHNAGVIQDKSLDKCTRLGRFLRKTELNELPQLINVLQKTMSIVGPRAAYPEEVRYYSNYHYKRLRLKPGITGMWQVSRHTTDGSVESMLRTDVWYVEHWSFWLDVKICLKTAGFLFKRLLRVS